MTNDKFFNSSLNLSNPKSHFYSLQAIERTPEGPNDLSFVIYHFSFVIAKLRLRDFFR